MSPLEETGAKIIVRSAVREKAGESLFARFLKLVCSVRFGVILLILLGLACFLGMIIMQQNVDGFDRYYAELKPAQKLVYGSLGLFDIYHSWYFNALLLILSLNIILASIDRFPKTWRSVAKPVLTPPMRWLKDQDQAISLTVESQSKEAIAGKIVEAFKKSAWRKTTVSEKNDRTFVFAEAGVWNRFAYLAVHVGLLTIFVGGFLTGQLGNTGQMALQPGQTSNEIFDTVSNLDQLTQVTKRLPFEIFCTDIQQKLIKKDESISAMNTIDWLTRIQIKDETGTTNAVVQMNRPFDYRGYRFFQASFVSVGRARNINVRLKSADGAVATEDVTIPRSGTIALADGTQIRFVDFRGNFSIGKEDLNEDTSNYPNPAAVLQVTPPNAAAQTAYAFGAQMADIPIAKKPIAGYTYQLVDFEKVADQHILSIQRDPGSNVVYVGFTLLFLTLVAVFFFSHQRIWAVVEKNTENNFTVTIGGNTNRNKAAFDEKFKRFVKVLREQNKEIQSL
ncbi:MAG: cytochrome c biogenesis protein ResB [Actinomycetota bacterium]